MSSFSPNQLKLLTGKLDRSHVRQREVEGRSLSYIEGWFAIAEANRIFGYGGWDRQMVHFERTHSTSRGDVTDCGFMARVRVTVRTGGTVIVRESTGFGSASARTPADAYDRAIKAAETDATKRALATFGNRFGLCLYDKEQRGVEDVVPAAAAPANSKSANIFRLFSPEGTMLAGSLSAEGFCSGLRQVIEASKRSENIDALKFLNAGELAKLRELRPDLCNRSGIHYADLLSGLMEKRRGKLASLSTPPEPPDLSGASGWAEVICATANANEVSLPALSTPLCHVEVVPEKTAEVGAAIVADPTAQQNGHAETKTLTSATAESSPDGLPASRITGGPRVDKSVLSIRSPRRTRDPDHLRAVRKLPCVICERTPCHAHHVKFAQRPGLSMKVSDEFVVPLCSVHHDELHRSVTERSWWESQGIDPLAVAGKLWRGQREPLNP